MVKTLLLLWFLLPQPFAHIVQYFYEFCQYVQVVPHLFLLILHNFSTHFSTQNPFYSNLRIFCMCNNASSCATFVLFPKNDANKSHLQKTTPYFFVFLSQKEKEDIFCPQKETTYSSSSFRISKSALFL